MPERPALRVIPKTPACPVCGSTEDRPGRAKYRPFCSARCADIDLGRWLKGVYRVETDEAPEDGATPAGGDKDGER